MAVVASWFEPEELRGPLAGVALVVQASQQLGESRRVHRTQPTPSSLHHLVRSGEPLAETRVVERPESAVGGGVQPGLAGELWGRSRTGLAGGNVAGAAVEACAAEEYLELRSQRLVQLGIADSTAGDSTLAGQPLVGSRSEPELGVHPAGRRQPRQVERECTAGDSKRLERRGDSSPGRDRP